VLALGLGACGSGNGGEKQSTGQWSVFEDHTALVRSGHERRERTLGARTRFASS
jgi:predicted metal-dependent hydrolase